MCPLKESVIAYVTEQQNGYRGRLVLFTAYSVLKGKLIIIAGASRGYNTFKGNRYHQLDKKNSSADAKEDTLIAIAIMIIICFCCCCRG